MPNVLVNDTLNGAPVTLAQVNLTQVSTSNPGITLDPATGAVTVPAGLPAGAYTLTCQICEQLNPTNCDTAVVTITVGNGEIIANEDAGSVPTTGGVAVPNVLVNDSLNGAPVMLPQVILTVISEASEAGVLLNPATGQVTVAPGTPAGTYQLAYQICERVNPTNCDPAKVTVTVAAGSIIANEDSSTVPSTGGVAVPNVLINDTLNGAPVTLSQVNLTQSASSNPGITLDPVSGAVNVAPSLPAGTYTLTYQICEKLNPDNCDTAAVTVSIDPPLANASVSGTAFYDMDGDRMASPRDQRMSGFIVELLRIENGAERVVGTARTDSEGRYVIANQVPGTGYMIRFRDPVGNVIVGSPFNQAASTQAGNPSTGTNALMQPVAPNVVTPVSGVIANITLYGTDNTIAQNLPLDPNGVIYDSVTRQPLAGATVRIVGPAGFDPARHVVGGSDTFVTGALGYYQFLFINSPPNGTYRFVVTPPSGYTPGQAVAGGVAPAQGVYQVTAGRHEIQPNRTPPAAGVNGLPGTVYHYVAAFNFSGAPGEIVNNHIPFDPIGAATGTMRVTKSAQQRSIKLGDLVRYTLIVENTGTVPVVDGTLIDTPPAGFTYVDGSLTVGDRNGAGRLVGSNPLSVDQIDIAVGERATLTYLMRVGAGVRPGTYTNRAQMRDDGQGASNVATADVQVVGDPMTDVSTILGTVFDDRNGDGSQQEGEAGIPGVRIVSVEGLVIETDQFGRYHLAGLPISNSERGSNVILKVDPATLPAATPFTTDNPLVRRVTQGLPIRFDFGVQLPAGEASGSAQEIEMKLGEVFFAPGSAQMSDGYRSAIDQMAAGVRKHGAGEVVIEADGESEALALERALAVQRALEGVLKPAELANVRISVQTKSSPGQMVAGLQQTPLLGVVLFDTDRATIKPQYRALIQQMAKLIEETRATRIVITGHADRRGDEQYNLELGQRRAAAVTEAIASQLSPELRGKLRVETERLPVAGGK